MVYRSICARIIHGWIGSCSLDLIHYRVMFHLFNTIGSDLLPA